MEITPHSSFDSLLDAIVKIAGAPLDDLTPLPVVVPSIVFEDYLEQGLARRLGVCMGLNLMTPQNFIQFVTSKCSNASHGRGRPWSSDELRWRVVSKIQSVERNVGMQGASTRDRFAMAGMIADQLDQYAHFRPEIIRQWASGKKFHPKNSKQAFEEAEEWQRQLWGSLKADIEEPLPHCFLPR